MIRRPSAEYSGRGRLRFGLERQVRRHVLVGDDDHVVGQRGARLHFEHVGQFLVGFRATARPQAIGEVARGEEQQHGEQPQPVAQPFLFRHGALDRHFDRRLGLRGRCLGFRRLDRRRRNLRRLGFRRLGFRRFDLRRFRLRRLDLRRLDLRGSTFGGSTFGGSTFAGAVATFGGAGGSTFAGSGFVTGRREGRGHAGELQAKLGHLAFQLPHAVAQREHRGDLVVLVEDQLALAQLGARAIVELPAAREVHFAGGKPQHEAIA
jgi:hypothetical protein